MKVLYAHRAIHVRSDNVFRWSKRYVQMEVDGHAVLVKMASVALARKYVSLGNGVGA
jgi:hypothetical protein